MCHLAQPNPTAEAPRTGEKGRPLPPPAGHRQGLRGALTSPWPFAFVSTKEGAAGCHGNCRCMWLAGTAWPQAFATGIDTNATSTGTSAGTSAGTKTSSASSEMENEKDELSMLTGDFDMGNLLEMIPSDTRAEKLSKCLEGAKGIVDQLEKEMAK